MIKYLFKNRPTISLFLILISFLLNVITISFIEKEIFLQELPSKIGDWHGWYKFLQYPFYLGTFKIWFLHLFAIFLYGFIIENRLKAPQVMGLILISIIIGGAVFVFSDKKIALNNSIIILSMISWGYWAATIVIGLKFWKNFNLFEKCVMIFVFLGALNLFEYDLFFLLEQKIVILLIIVLTLIYFKNIKPLTN